VEAVQECELSLPITPGGCRGAESPGRAVPFRKFLAVVLWPDPMIIRRIFSPRHEVESLKVRHAANPATVASYPISAAAVERDCLGPDKPVSRRS
jgi:hypothetical protein